MNKIFFEQSIYKKYRNVIILIIDLGIVALSFFFAYWAQSEFSIPSLKTFNLYKLLLGMGLVLTSYLFSFLLFKIQRSLWTYISSAETLRIGLSVLVATLFLVVIVLASGSSITYISVAFIGGLISALAMYNVRIWYLQYRKSTSKGNNLSKKQAIIIGAGNGGYILLKELLQNKSESISIVGFVDDKKEDLVLSGYKVIGNTHNLKEIVEKYNIEIAFIAIPSASSETVRRIYYECQKYNLTTKIMKNADYLLEDEQRRLPIENISIVDLLGRGEIHLHQGEIHSYLSNKIVAVTGAGGSIGSELCRQIVRFNPLKLVMIDIDENALYMLEQEFNRSKMHNGTDKEIKIISDIASIRDYQAISALLKQHEVSVVFHAAAHKHVPLMETRPIEAIKNNIFGTKNVMDACIANKVERFILISTDKAVHPTNVMGATKRFSELMLQSYGKNGVTKFAAVRFGNVLGSNGSVIPIFKNQIENGGPITLTDKNIVRYFMSIPEAAQLVLQAGYYAHEGEIFVLDMGEPVKIIDLAEKMIKLSGLKPYEDIDIIEIGLRPGEKMFEELHLDGEQVVKTKNDLIFKNNPMEINQKEIGQMLDVLSKMIEQNLSNIEIKQTVMDLIAKYN